MTKFILRKSKVMVTPLLLLSSEDNWMMDCLPVCLSMFMIRSSTGSCGVKRLETLTKLPRSLLDPLVVQLAGQHWLNHLHLSYSATLKRLVRSLNYLSRRLRRQQVLQELMEVWKIQRRVRMRVSLSQVLQVLQVAKHAVKQVRILYYTVIR